MSARDYYEVLGIAKGASDADIEFAYRNAHFLLQASEVEGFGLPIIEAAANGLPLLITDIAVFREIAGDHARYFEAGDVDSLHRRLMEPGPFERSDPAIGVSWRESACRLETLCVRGGWDHMLD